MTADDIQTVWCRADLSPFGTGTYTLTIEYDADNVLGLNRDELLDYVAVMNEAMTRAIYTEAVRRQLRHDLKISDRHAIETILELRDEWPELRSFGPYEIRPNVSIEGRPSVQVWRTDGTACLVQFAPSNVREHVLHALQVYAGADLDASYRRYLRGVIGVDDTRATAAVEALNKWMPKDDELYGLDRVPDRPARRRPGRRRR